MLNGSIEDNVISYAASSGIVITNPSGGLPGDISVNITKNEIVFARLDGISVVSPPPIEALSGGCLITENTVQAAGRNGIYLGNLGGCKIHDNVLHQNGGDGIVWQEGGHGLILENVASGNGGTGIRIDAAGVQIDNNAMTSNGACGLYLGGRNNTYGRNSASGNGGAGTCPAVCGLAVPSQCWPSSPPPGPGNTSPDFCDAGSGNKTFCNNLMPGPPPL